MKSTKYIPLTALFFAGLWMAGCDNKSNEPESEPEPEPKYNIVGEWGDCRTCKVRYTFPEDGIMGFYDRGDKRTYTVKYRLIAGGDTLQFISVLYDPYGDVVNYLITVDSYRIHIYTNDSIMIEFEDGGVPLVRIEE